ncbi:MAG: homoserine dehydrogenase [Clostridia bacterium]|nr:homoserine dehydrogenase [Clostridia bacterium]
MDATRNTINVGMLGFGTVGAGVYRVLAENAAEIGARVGRPVRISRILVKDPTKPRPLRFDRSIITCDASDILSDPDIDIVVELIGNSHPALEYTLQAIGNGHHVVTANKEAIAKYGDRIFQAAASSGVDVRFEGSVAGGIPIIRSIVDSLAANRVESILGIVNGTTNFILTQMTENHTEFGDALCEAQRLGYAEANPSDDIEGYDAAYKTAILASVGFSAQVAPEMVSREGISRIHALDIGYARDLGYVVKMVACARRRCSGLELWVRPTLVHEAHPLASVAGAYNAVMVRGNASGDLMFSGRGAGDLPTASAVVGDIVEIAEGIVHSRGPRTWRSAGSPAPVYPNDELESSFYIRTVVDDSPGVLASIAGVFATLGVSLQSVIQKGRKRPVDVVFITHPAKLGAVRTAVDQIKAGRFVHDVPAVIPALDDPEWRGALS